LALNVEEMSLPSSSLNAIGASKGQQRANLPITMPENREMNHVNLRGIFKIYRPIKASNEN